MHTRSKAEQPDINGKLVLLFVTANHVGCRHRLDVQEEHRDNYIWHSSLRPSFEYKQLRGKAGVLKSHIELSAYLHANITQQRK